MTMRFPFRRLPVSQPIVPLRGRMNRPRPLITVSVGGPGGVFPMDGLLDTGADDCIFPEWVASVVGISSLGVPTGAVRTAMITTGALWYAEVTLRVADNQERREWQAWVGFTSAPIRQAYLGFAGFLEFFETCFLGDQEVVTLTVNSNYPGP